MASPASHYHGIDVVALNALVTDIRKRLTGGLSGNFFEQGGILKEGSRHAQLPLLFDAMSKIDNLISGMEKQAIITEADNNKEAQKPGGGGKPNKSMMATIKEMVHAEVELRTRTVTIESERMKAAMQKLESQNVKLVDEVAAVKSKLKKGGGQPASGSDEKYHALSKKFDSVQKTQKQYEAGQVSLTCKVTALEESSEEAAAAAFVTDRDIALIRQTTSVCKQKLGNLETGLEEHKSETSASQRQFVLCTKIDETRYVKVVDMIICFQKKFGMPTWLGHVIPDWLKEKEVEETPADSCMTGDQGSGVGWDNTVNVADWAGSGGWEDAAGSDGIPAGSGGWEDAAESDTVWAGGHRWEDAAWSDTISAAATGGW